MCRVQPALLPRYYRKGEEQRRVAVYLSARGRKRCGKLGGAGGVEGDTRGRAGGLEVNINGRQQQQNWSWKLGEWTMATDGLPVPRCRWASESCRRQCCPMRSAVWGGDLGLRWLMGSLAHT